MNISYNPRENYVIFHVKQSGDNGRGYYPCRVNQMFEYLGVNSFMDCKMTKYKEYTIISNKYSTDAPNTTFPRHNGRCIMVEIVEGELSSISERYVSEVLSDKNTRVDPFNSTLYKPGQFATPTLEQLKKEKEEDKEDKEENEKKK